MAKPNTVQSGVLEVVGQVANLQAGPGGPDRPGAAVANRRAAWEVGPHLPMPSASMTAAVARKTARSAPRPMESRERRNARGRPGGRPRTGASAPREDDRSQSEQRDRMGLLGIQWA